MIGPLYLADEQAFAEYMAGLDAKHTSPWRVSHDFPSVRHYPAVLVSHEWYDAGSMRAEYAHGVIAVATLSALLNEHARPALVPLRLEDGIILTGADTPLDELRAAAQHAIIQHNVAKTVAAIDAAVAQLPAAPTVDAPRSRKPRKPSNE